MPKRRLSRSVSRMSKSELTVRIIPWRETKVVVPALSAIGIRPCWRLPFPKATIPLIPRSDSPPSPPETKPPFSRRQPGAENPPWRGMCQGGFFQNAFIYLTFSLNSSIDSRNSSWLWFVSVRHSTSGPHLSSLKPVKASRTERHALKPPPIPPKTNNPGQHAVAQDCL